jgi:hypothetical protein
MDTQTQENLTKLVSPIYVCFAPYMESRQHAMHLDFFPKESRHQNTSRFPCFLFLKRKKTRVVLLSSKEKDGCLYPVFKKTDGYSFPDKDSAEKYLGRRIRGTEEYDGKIDTIHGVATHQICCDRCNKFYSYGTFKITLSGNEKTLDAKNLSLETGQEVPCMVCEELTPLLIKIVRTDF